MFEMHRKANIKWGNKTRFCSELFVLSEVNNLLPTVSTLQPHFLTAVLCRWRMSLHCNIVTQCFHFMLNTGMELGKIKWTSRRKNCSLNVPKELVVGYHIEISNTKDWQLEINEKGWEDIYACNAHNGCAWLFKDAHTQRDFRVSSFSLEFRILLHILVRKNSYTKHSPMSICINLSSFRISFYQLWIRLTTQIFTVETLAFSSLSSKNILWTQVWQLGLRSVKLHEVIHLLSPCLFIVSQVFSHSSSIRMSNHLT